MKSRRTKTVFTILVLAGLALGSVFAEGKSGDDPLEAFFFPPELVMQHQNRIGLSAEQKATLREEVARAQQRFTSLQWNLQDAFERFAGTLDAPTLDEGRVLQGLEQVLDAEREVKRAQIRLLVSIKNLLDEDQQAELRRVRAGTR